MKEGLEAKDARLEALELKVTRLEETVQQQESLIIALRKEMPSASSDCVPINVALNDNQSVGKIALVPRTCREVHAAEPSLNSGMHWIDPDGQGVGDDPIYVYCDMAKGLVHLLGGFF